MSPQGKDQSLFMDGVITTGLPRIGEMARPHMSLPIYLAKYARRHLLNDTILKTLLQLCAAFGAGTGHAAGHVHTAVAGFKTFHTDAVAAIASAFTFCTG